MGRRVFRTENASYLPVLTSSFQEEVVKEVSSRINVEPVPDISVLV